MLRRGVAPSASTLAAFLAEEGAAQAVPRGLVQATVKVKSLFLLAEAGTSGGQALPPSSWRKGAKTMFLTKVKIAAAVLLSVGLLGVGAGTVVRQVLADKPATGVAPLLAKIESPQGKTAPLPDTPPHTAVPAQPTSGRILRVVVLDPQGKPGLVAHLHADIWIEISSQPRHKAEPPDVTGDYETDPAGIAQIQLPKTFQEFRLRANTRQFVPIVTVWSDEIGLASGEKMPAEFTFHLDSGRTAGGRVVDEQGKPIASANVQVLGANIRARPVHGDPAHTAYDMWLATGKNAATTDAEGRWRIRNVPSETGGLQLLISHPDYASDETWRQAQNAAGVTTEMLLQGMETVATDPWGNRARAGHGCGRQADQGRAHCTWR